MDDDEAMREALPELLKTLGFETAAFSSAEAFLASDAPARADCLVLDIGMPHMSGPELQRELARADTRIPIVFITGHAEPRLIRRLLEAGAVDCLLKPFSDEAIAAAVTAALGKNRR